MNLGTLIGFLGATAVFVFSVFGTFSSFGFIIDFRSLMLVFGGTVAVSLVCFPVKRIYNLLRVFFGRILGTRTNDYMGIIGEVCTLARAARSSNRALEAATSEVKSPFLGDCARVLLAIDNEVSEDELRVLLETKAQAHYTEYMNEAQIFRTMAKFPPAFGLMGTVLGMMGLMDSLGDNGGTGVMGKAMALSLITTLYGLLISNFVFLPVAENLNEQTRDDYLARQIVVEGVMLVRAKRPVRYIEERLKSFLIPSKRQESGGTSPGDARKAA